MSALRRGLAIFLLLGTAASLSAQTTGGLGMEPTPQNFNNSIRSGTAKAGQREMPTKVDLSTDFPAPGYQGQQNSCVAWATAYAVKTYQENVERKWGTTKKENIFSPSFIYNQINGGRDQGSTIPDALELVKKQGCATLKTMPYSDYRTQPDSTARSEAVQYKAESYVRLDGKNPSTLKAVLADGNPVVIGMKTYENFMTYKGGVYKSVSGSYLGGHAMVAVGYDDGKKAFKILNSWSEQWGEKGYCWYDYDLFTQMNHTAMVMFDAMKNTPEKSYPPNEVSASTGAYTDRIQVTWPEVKSAEYYVVFRSERMPTDFKEVAKTKGTTYVDAKAVAKVEYFYSVKSVGPGGTSDYSPVAKGWVKESRKELGSPKNLRGMQDGDRVKLVWDPVEDAEGYYVYRWDNGVKEFRRVGVSRNEGWQDSAVPKDSRQERYVVTAYREKTESKADEGLTVVIVRKEPESVNAPSWIKASKGDSRDKIVVTWEKVAGADSYTVRKWSEKGKTWTFLARQKEASYTDSKPRDKKNLYSVIAVKGKLESEPSAIAEGYLADAPKKEEPKKFADDDYKSDFDKRAEKFFGDEKFFSDDSFFKGEATFFNNFEEENFFFFDEKAFFKFDEEKYFGKEDDFFGGDDDFFGGKKKR